jgi:hypothetical protein
MRCQTPGSQPTCSPSGNLAITSPRQCVATRKTSDAGLSGTLPTSKTGLWLPSFIDFSRCLARGGIIANVGAITAGG